MPFNGAGIFTRLRNWVDDATAGIKIRADYHDIEDDNFASGISNCIARDGQSTVLANIPMNSKRIVSLADPINPQDASTKTYADTKLALTGGTLTGNLTIQTADPFFILNGLSGHYNLIYGQKGGLARWAIALGDNQTEAGGSVGSNFGLYAYGDGGGLAGVALSGARNSALLTVYGNPTAALGIAPKQYVDAWIATRLPTTGGTISGSLTITGALTVGGEPVFQANYIRFGSSGGPGYLQWSGGATYVLGSGGTIYHTGNLVPVLSTRLLMAADRYTFGPGGNQGSELTHEPYAGAVLTGLIARDPNNGSGAGIVGGRWRWVQILTPNGWFTVSYV